MIHAERLRSVRRDLEAEWGEITDEQWKQLRADYSGFEDIDSLDDEGGSRLAADFWAFAEPYLRFQASGQSQGGVARGQPRKSGRAKRPQGPRGTYRKPLQERIAIVHHVDMCKELIRVLKWRGDFWATAARSWRRASKGKDITSVALERRYYRARETIATLGPAGCVEFLWSSLMADMRRRVRREYLQQLDEHVESQVGIRLYRMQRTVRALAAGLADPEQRRRFAEITTGLGRAIDRSRAQKRG